MECRVEAAASLPFQPIFLHHRAPAPSAYKLAERVEYVHLNPVRARLVGHRRDWRWSSFNEYAGMRPEEQLQRCGLTIDRVRISADPPARLSPSARLRVRDKRRGSRKAGRSALLAPRDAPWGIGGFLSLASLGERGDRRAGGEGVNTGRERPQRGRSGRTHAGRRPRRAWPPCCLQHP
jgi:hypothetical protein